MGLGKKKLDWNSIPNKKIYLLFWLQYYYDVWDLEKYLSVRDLKKIQSALGPIEKKIGSRYNTRQSSQIFFNYSTIMVHWN